ncbi:MAG: isopentenyl-diphosphate delta-isomerase, partial [Saprospiraceae bacterium]|nr:isopentenyl-diphosphate delta-isomerase [Saprospiraceae bacterium]
MNSKENIQNRKEDPTAAQRKKDHIELAFQSQVSAIDERFYYEPLLSGLGSKQNNWGAFQFLGKEMKNPLWVSSMTGGTEWAGTINANLAKAVKEFGLGMGLGSCRSLLYDDAYFEDFNVRKLVGDQPLYANLGIAQIEHLLDDHQMNRAIEMVKKLEADGLIIHINPLQEAMQPEGDNYQNPPIETIKKVLDLVSFPIIVKEVGQGMGPESLDALLRLPLAAVDFAASGGTNFALLELLRDDKDVMEAFEPITHIGHKAEEMVEIFNNLKAGAGS